MTELVTDLVLYHGGVPDLRVGDLIEPGNTRPVHEGCAMCEANAARKSVPGSPITQHLDKVYLSPNRLYARHYASLYGRGDLYRVEPVGDVVRSTEDSIETWMAPAARVASIIERAVLLTMSERRRLFRQWTDADRAAGWA